MARALCKQCTRPLAACYCHLLIKLPNRWPVLVLQHVQEAKHPLNTARIAALCLQNCKVVRVPDAPGADIASLLPVPPTAAQPVLIYPGDGSLPLAELPLDVPVPLVFIDASWRKSRRLLLQHEWLRQLPRYSVDAATPSRYRIRREPRAGYLSTLESIVQVLAARESCPVQAMLGIMDWMVDRQIAAMGPATWQRNY